MKEVSLLFFMCYVFLFPQSLHPQHWQKVGLEGEAVTVLAVDPADESILYAGSMRGEKEWGLHRSLDGGTTWNSLLEEAVWDLDFHPQNPDIMYVCSDRLLKSVDKGETWFYADSGTVDAERANGMFGHLVINPNQPDVLLVTQTYGLTVVTSIMYKTENGGKSWRRLAFPTYVASAVAVDPFCDNTVYAGGNTRDYVYKSTDFGETWEQWQDAGPNADWARDIKIVSIGSVVFHVIARGGQDFTSRKTAEKPGNSKMKVYQKVASLHRFVWWTLLFILEDMHTNPIQLALNQAFLRAMLAIYIGNL